MKHKNHCTKTLTGLLEEKKSFSFKRLTAGLAVVLMMGAALAAEPFTSSGSLSLGHHHVVKSHAQKHNSSVADPFAELNESTAEAPAFSSLTKYGLSPSKSLTQASQKGHFQTASGRVLGRASQSFKAAGIPQTVISQIARAFGKSNLDKQLKQGDTFRVLYENASTKNQASAKLLSVELSIKGQKQRRFWYSAGNEGAGFYDERGVAAQSSSFIRIPLAKMTGIGSPFSAGRLHPVTGVVRPHYGTDFRAPRGTAVFASNDGVVEFAGWGNGYGRMVKIRHANGYETIYGHLASIGKNVKVGSNVQRGETIGAVGSSGLSTGNHLHYEIRQFGKPYDPMKIQIAAAPRLSDQQMAQLKVNIAYLSRQLDAIPMDRATK